MKIGWLVWLHEDDTPEFHKDGFEPDYCYKKIRIVYAEVTDD